MKVYLAYHHTTWGGAVEINGVYSTREKADEAMKEFEPVVWDLRVIMEIEVDQMYRVDSDGEDG